MTLHVLGAHPDAWALGGSRLWRTRFDGAVEPYLAEHGRPITYGYVRGRWPLSAYQTIFARHQSSAEMPSAARPFTHRLVTELVSLGVNLAPIVLHCGVSSLEAGETPQSERFKVPSSTAWLVNETRKAGGRVIAVGTTATRALETVAAEDGTVHADEGWTDLVLGPEHPAWTVDGLITGWHQPGASHLSLLEAVAGAELVQSAYDEALDAEYLWHEFGDSCLLLPDRDP
jgi:S-adenosylmethionine:tRNA ribosyltransferase-isomerase